MILIRATMTCRGAAKGSTDHVVPVLRFMERLVPYNEWWNADASISSQERSCSTLPTPSPLNAGLKI